MAQHDYDIANQSGYGFRQDLNNALAAIVSNNSGASAPATTYAHQIWIDTSTTPATIKRRDASNASWITIGLVDGSINLPTVNATAPTNGLYLPAANSVALATNSTSRLYINSSGSVGIGTTSPTFLNGNYSGTHIHNSLGTSVKLTNNTTGTAATDGFELIVESGAATAYVYQRENADMVFGTNNQEKVRLDASGRLLVGTSTARSNLDGASPLQQIEGTSFNTSSLSLITNQSGIGGPEIMLAKSKGSTLTSNTVVADADYLGAIGFLGNNNTDFLKAASIACQVDGTPNSGGDTTDMPGRLVFSTTADGASSPTERMRITNSGRIFAATQTEVFPNFTLHVVGSSGACAFKETSGTADSNLQVNWHTATSGNNRFIEFGTEGTYTLRGSITFNRGGGVVAYNTTSDYRAKTLIGTLENPGETIDALRVYRGLMNGATIERPMLVAHEAQEVAPYCVTGEKDAVDDDGNPIYQQMDHQVLVPLLIAEIQQLRARVAALETA